MGATTKAKSGTKAGGRTGGKAPKQVSAPLLVPSSDAPTWIHPSLHSSMMNVGDLIADEKNARVHSAKNMEAIAHSLRLHGQMLPLVVDARNRVLMGNARLAVIRGTDLPLVPGDETNVGRWPVVAVLRFKGGAREARALALSDNRTAELAAWNYESLAASLKELVAEEFDLTRLGWDEHEYGPLLEGDFTPQPLGDLPRSPDGSAHHHGHTVQLDDAQWGKLERCREKMTKQEGGRSKPSMAEVVEWLADRALKRSPSEK